MKNEIKIGIGIVVVAGTLYYFLRKKKPMDIDALSSTPSSADFDREKCAKQYSVTNFPKMKELYLMNQIVGVGQTAMLPFSELTIYDRVLTQLNKVTDDSDAQFVCSVWNSKSGQLDLNSQIKIKNIINKYPNFNFEMHDKIVPLSQAIVTTSN